MGFPATSATITAGGVPANGFSFVPEGDEPSLAVAAVRSTAVVAVCATFVAAVALFTVSGVAGAWLHRGCHHDAFDD